MDKFSFCFAIFELLVFIYIGTQGLVLDSISKKEENILDLFFLGFLSYWEFGHLLFHLRKVIQFEEIILVTVLLIWIRSKAILQTGREKERKELKEAVLFFKLLQLTYYVYLLIKLIITFLH